MLNKNLSLFEKSSRSLKEGGLVKSDVVDELTINADDDNVWMMAQGEAWKRRWQRSKSKEIHDLRLGVGWSKERI